MGIAATIAGALGGAIQPLASVFQKREERKQAVESAKIKQGTARQEGQDQITLTDAEFEAIGKNNENDTWKDEYLTLIIPSPIVLFLVGGLVAAYSGDTRMIEGTVAGLNALAAVGIDMGFLMEAVVLAGVSLKIWRAGK